MDQRSIDVFFRLKRFSAKVKDVHTELVHVLGSDVIAYSRVTTYIRNTVILQSKPEPEDRAEDQGFSSTDNAILEAVEMMPFTSKHQIAKMTFVPPTTRFHRVPKSLRFVLKRLRSVRHRLSDLQTQARPIM
jgi:hypothetical protein